VLLKTSAPEDLVLLKWWRHQKLFHQKLKFILSCRIWSLKSCSLNWYSFYIGRRLVEYCNGHFIRIWSHLVAKIQEALTLYSVRTVQPPYPLPCFMSLLQDKDNNSEIQQSLQPCSLSTGMHLKLILHRTIPKSGKKSLVKDQASITTLFWMCWHLQRSFHTSI